MKKPSRQFRLKTMLVLTVAFCVVSAIAKWELDARREFDINDVAHDVVTDCREQIAEELKAATADQLGELAHELNATHIRWSVDASLGEVTRSMHSELRGQTATIQVQWQASYSIPDVKSSGMGGVIMIESHRKSGVLWAHPTVTIIDRRVPARTAVLESSDEQPATFADFDGVDFAQVIILSLTRELEERGINVTVSPARRDGVPQPPPPSREPYSFSF